MPVRRYKKSYKKYSSWHYLVLYNALSTYDWSSLYNDTSTDAAVDRLNVAVTLVIDLAVPSGYIKQHKYPAWFSGKVKAYIKNNNIFCKGYNKYKAVSMTNFLLPKIS
jgi:hypothetical protein